MKNLFGVKYIKIKDGSYSDCFGPTLNDKHYKPKQDHRKKIPPANTKAQNEKNEHSHKSQWVVDESTEYHIFKQSDEENWFSEEKNAYFCICLAKDYKKTVIGASDECMAKFPKPQNSFDSWHGYPVSTEKDENCPCDTLIDIWRDNKIINQRISRQIIKGNI